ncbi:MAG: FixH family protein [Myxococcota bacterium]
MAASHDSLRWPLGLALTLAAGLAASLAFLWIALQQPPDVLPENSWNAGVEYNAAARAQASASARGWELELRAERDSQGVRVELRPRSAGDPLPTPIAVSLRRERPGRTDFDADIALQPAGDRWIADVPLPLAGRWILLARAGDAEAWVERAFSLEVAK